MRVPSAVRVPLWGHPSLFARAKGSRFLRQKPPLAYPAYPRCSPFWGRVVIKINELSDWCWRRSIPRPVGLVVIYRRRLLLLPPLRSSFRYPSRHVMAGPSGSRLMTRSRSKRKKRDWPPHPRIFPARLKISTVPYTRSYSGCFMNIYRFKTTDSENIATFSGWSSNKIIYTTPIDMATDLLLPGPHNVHYNSFFTALVYIYTLHISRETNFYAQEYRYCESARVLHHVYTVQYASIHSIRTLRVHVYYDNNIQLYIYHGRVADTLDTSRYFFFLSFYGSRRTFAATTIILHLHHYPCIRYCCSLCTLD